MTFTEQQLKNFRLYVSVQTGRRFNMMDPRARQATGLSRDDYLFVIENYDALEAAAREAMRRGE